MRSITVELNHRVETDLSYWLDSAEEFHRLAPDAAIWARYWCPNLAQIIERDNERNCTSDEYLEGLDQEAERVNREYIDWFDSIITPKEQKCAVVGLGIQNAHRYLEETAQYAAELTVHEHNPWLANVKAPEDCVVLHTIKEHFPKTRSGNNTISIFNLGPVKKQKKYQSVITHVAGMYARYQKIESSFPGEIRTRHVNVRRSVCVFQDTKARKAVRRGIDLLLELGFAYDQVRQFVTGKEPLVVQGQQVSFRLKLSRVSEALSHGSMTTEVWVGDERVCNMCLYTPQTPPLDHVVNIVTHVRLGLEHELIETGNPNNIGIDKPTGIEVLDRRLRLDRNSVYRVPLSDIINFDDDLAVVETEHDVPITYTREKEYVRLGPSDLAKSITEKRAKRLIRDMYREIDYVRFPKLSVIEI